MLRERTRGSFTGVSFKLSTERLVDWTFGNGGWLSKQREQYGYRSMLRQQGEYVKGKQEPTQQVDWVTLKKMRGEPGNWGCASGNISLVFV